MTQTILMRSLTGGLAEGFAAGFAGSGLSSSACGPFLA